MSAYHRAVRMSFWKQEDVYFSIKHKNAEPIQNRSMRRVSVPMTTDRNAMTSQRKTTIVTIQACGKIGRMKEYKIIE